MRRITLMVSTATVMSALILASALPALAAPPTFRATCYFPMSAAVFPSDVPQDYNDVLAIYRSCQDSGGTASIEITPQPGPPDPAK